MGKEYYNFDETTTPSDNSRMLLRDGLLNKNILWSTIKSFFMTLTGNQTISGVKTYTDPILASSGTAAAPSISFSADTDTGFYQIGTDTLGIATGGVERIRIDGIGDVLIGNVVSGKLMLSTSTNNYAKLNIGDAPVLLNGPMTSTTTVNQLSCATLQAVTSGTTYNNRTVTVLNTDAGNSTQSVQSLRADLEINGTTAGATVAACNAIQCQLNWNSATTTSTANQITGNFFANIYNGAPNAIVGCQGQAIYQAGATGTATLGTATGVVATSYTNKVGAVTTVQYGIDVRVGQTTRAANTITYLCAGNFTVQPGDAAVVSSEGIKVTGNVLSGATTNIGTLYGIYLDQTALPQGSGVGTKYGICQIDTDAPNLFNSKLMLSTATNNYAKLNIGDAPALVASQLASTTTVNQLSCATLQAVTSGTTYNNRTITVLNTDAGNSTQGVQSLRADLEINGTTAGATVATNYSIIGSLYWNSATASSTTNQTAGGFFASIYNGAPNILVGCQGQVNYQAGATGTATVTTAIGVLANAYNNKAGATVTTQFGATATAGQSTRAASTITNLYAGNFTIQPGDAAVSTAAGIRVFSNILNGATTNIGTLYGILLNQSLLVQGSGVTTKYGIYQTDTDAPNVLNSRVDMLKGAKLSGLSVYADNASALADGKVAGDVYRTSTGVLMVVY